MKLLRLSLLLTLFSNKTTQSKFLRFINIGIFLSIFAITSAVISFIIETKIDKIEFELIENHKEQRSNKKSITGLNTLQSQYSVIQNSGKALRDLYEFTGATKLGEYTISVKDLYLPSVYAEVQSGDWYTDLDAEGAFEGLEQIFEDYFGEDSEELKKYRNSLKELRKYQEYISKNDFSKYYNEIYNYDANLVRDEVTTKSSINYFNDEIYKHYKKIEKIFPDIIVLIELINEYYSGLSIYYEDSIADQNKEIIKLSKLESNIIIVAFILQFIIFIIIQYFEINTIQTTREKNAKRKNK